MASNPLPDIPAINLTFPSSPLVLSALAHAKEHTSTNTVNHCVRGAYFAVIVAKKHPAFAGKQLNMELVVSSTILHDLGWAKTNSMISADRRYEVDGADRARVFLEKHTPWDEHELQLAWDAIALHTTPSIAQYKQAEVALAGLGILHDFLGPGAPSCLITEDEYKAVTALFPRVGWTNEYLQIMCGICREKPETTYDNFVSYFGLTYGLDGKGGEKDKYERNWQDNSIPPRLVAGMQDLENMKAQ